MLLSRAVPLVSVAVALAGQVVALAPSGGVDVVPVLTSAPFGAVDGQLVTHTILVSGTGTGNLTGVRLTFSTTVGLDGVAASASQGACSIVDALTVVCELGVVDFPNADAAPPRVMITGTVKPGTARGALVRNLVNVTSEPPDADVSNNAASNAYLIPGSNGSPTSRPSAARSSDSVGRRPGYLVPVAAAVLVLGALATLILLRRRRS
ncbi:hypothetical protein ACPPVO_54490 [Dactylosporangium sp. McL0621]|uniref:hypothetical protein n=1 Tax=Dactylosporangium sp. McL0621 TaxID=3415678 RepID=UPI003CEE943C